MLLAASGSRSLHRCAAGVAGLAARGPAEARFSRSRGEGSAGRQGPPWTFWDLRPPIGLYRLLWEPRIGFIRIFL